MKKVKLFFFLLTVSSMANAIPGQPSYSSFGAQVQAQAQLGAYQQGRVAGQMAYAPGYRQVPSIGEGYADDPCAYIYRNDNSGLATYNGQVMRVNPNFSH